MSEINRSYVGNPLLSHRDARPATATDSCKALLDSRKLLPYVAGMIRSFRDKALERFFATGDGRRLSVQNSKRVANIFAVARRRIASRGHELARVPLSCARWPR